MTPTPAQIEAADEIIAIIERHYLSVFGTDRVDRLRALAAAAETLEDRTIERCAQVAETYPVKDVWDATIYTGYGLVDKGQDIAARDIAAAIRALGDKK